jgi:hypothetical protein
MSEPKICFDRTILLQCEKDIKSRFLNDTKEDINLRVPLSILGIVVLLAIIASVL